MKNKNNKSTTSMCCNETIIEIIKLLIKTITVIIVINCNL